MSHFNLNYSWNTETSGRRIALALGILLSGGNLLFPRLPLLFLLTAITLITLRNRPLPLRRTKPIALLLSTVILLWIIRPGTLDFGSLSIRYANFIGAFLLLLLYIKAGQSQFARDLAWLMPWVAYQTLLTFVLANTAPGLFVSAHTPDGGTFNTIFLIFNYHNLIQDYSGWNRPDGFFFEPGVLQIYLNLYLLVSLFVFKRRNHAVLATAAIVTTISTVGILIAGAQIVVYLIVTWRTAKRQTKKHLLLAVIFLSPIWISLSAQNIEDKFFGEARGSSLARAYDLMAGLQIIEKYPLIGIGFDHQRYLAETANLPDFASALGYESTPERQTSNGLLNLTYSLGIPIALIFVVGLIRQQIIPYGKAVGAIVFVCSLSEALLFTPFFLLLIFSGLLLTPKIGTFRSHNGLLLEGVEASSSSQKLARHETKEPVPQQQS